MKHILDVYQELEVTFSWQEKDVMILDNILVAHARNPFKGLRKLFVSIGDMNVF
jgi:alpha-ketoglutarate-dependent taurine dioxygenase